MIGRFAPSTTGEAHPGTLLAALIAWLAAKSCGGACLLRLEDLDRHRSQPSFVRQMLDDLTWFGLVFDDVVVQSSRAHQHRAALENLARKGLLYACSCSRAVIARLSKMNQDGARLYNNACRHKGPLNATDLHRTNMTLRICLDGVPADPVVLRRDGAASYLLACVVDDAAMGITHIVRGRDLASQQRVQSSLARALGLPAPEYRHHLLLLERQRQKMAKMHQSLPVSTLRRLGPAEKWVGALAHISGVAPDPRPVRPQALVEHFSWNKLRRDDQLVELRDDKLQVVHSAQEPF